MRVAQISKEKLGVVLVPLLFLAGCQSTQKNQVSVNYYYINGNSTDALDKEIQRKGPKINGGRHAIAVAKIKILPSIAYSSYAGGCKVSDAKVTVDAKVTLPKWRGRSKASKLLGNTWDSIDRYTRMHEAVHVSTAFRFAKIIQNELLALDQKGSCQSLKNSARALVDKRLEEHDEQQKAFDAAEQKRFLELAKKAA